MFPDYLSVSYDYDSYQDFKELQYVDLQLDLQRITTCKGSKNYNMQIYKELQLEKWYDIFSNYLSKF